MTPALRAGARVLHAPGDTLRGTRPGPCNAAVVIRRRGDASQAFAHDHVGGERWDPAEPRASVTGHLSSCGPCTGPRWPGQRQRGRSSRRPRGWPSGSTHWPTRVFAGPAPALLRQAEQTAWRPPAPAQPGLGFPFGAMKRSGPGSGGGYTTLRTRQLSATVDVARCVFYHNDKQTLWRRSSSVWAQPSSGCRCGRCGSEILGAGSGCVTDR